MSDNRITLSDFQALIRARYFETDNARGAAGTFLWFSGEVGELASALATTTKPEGPTAAERENLEEEFADVIAWLATLANITGVDLTKAVAKYTKPGGVEGVKHKWASTASISPFGMPTRRAGHRRSSPSCAPATRTLQPPSGV